MTFNKTFTFRVMGGPAEVQLFTESKIVAETISKEILLEAYRIEAKFSRYNKTSVITSINTNAAEKNIILDQETAALINYADTCYTESNGLFDITSGVLRRAWDFKTKVPPTPNTISDILPLVGWDKAVWEDPKIALLPGMEIDLGGVAKEYAVDRLASLAEARGVASGLINLAGDLKVIGKRPDNKPWRVGIKHPRIPSATIASLEINAGAVATSGDYERYFEADGKRYFHILNPKTGYPPDYTFQSVTVFAESCLVAGSASTIAILKGEKDGLSLLSALDLPFFAVLNNGKVMSSRLRSHSDG